MKRLITLSIGLLVIASLAGCAATNLDSPCSDYGKWCSKTPINSWNYNQ